MLADERLQLTDQRGVTAGVQIPLHLLLEASQSEFLESGNLALSKLLVRELGKWPPAPEPQCFDEVSL